nr:hypothetical protein [Tanacetum cinerariifolium]
TFTIVGNTCPLTRITTTAKVPLRKPIVLESNPPKPVVTLVYSRKPKESRNNVPVSKSKINKFLSADKKEPNKSWGSTVSNIPSSSTDECRQGLVRGLPKLKFEKYHLCSACEIGKISKSKINKFLSADKKEPNKSWGSTVSNIPSSSTDECRLSKLFSGIWTSAAPST